MSERMSDLQPGQDRMTVDISVCVFFCRKTSRAQGRDIRKSPTIPGSIFWKRNNSTPENRKNQLAASRRLSARFYPQSTYVSGALIQQSFPSANAEHQLFTANTHCLEELFSPALDISQSSAKKQPQNCQPSSDSIFRLLSN